VFIVSDATYNYYHMRKQIGQKNFFDAYLQRMKESINVVIPLQNGTKGQNVPENVVFTAFFGPEWSPSPIRGLAEKALEKVKK